MLRISACVALCLFSFGCEEEAKETKPAEKPVEVKPAKVVPDPKPAKAEDPKKAEAAAAQAEVEANPLTKCCRALGQRGFMQRSPDYMAASKVCGEAMKEKGTKAGSLPAIKKALGKEALPPECE